MEYIVSVSVFLLFILLACALGKKFLCVFGFNFHSATEKHVFAFGTGFAAIAYIVLMLGMAGVLYQRLVIPVFTLIFLVLLPEVKGSIEEVLRGLRYFKNISSYTEGTLKALIVLVTLIMLLGALAPSYSNDSMSYHLTDAKYFVYTHSVGQIPNNSTNALWPYLVEMYFTLAILLKLLPLAGLFHFSLAVFAAIGVYAFSKRFFSDRIGLLAAAIFILTPGIFMEAKETYVDLGMVFYTLAAFYAFLTWMDNRESKWLVLSGAMCGFAMSIKYFISIIPAILALYLIFTILKSNKQERAGAVKGVIIFSVVAFLTSFVWYLRQYIVTGNPFFPFFYKIFGTSFLDTKILELLSEKTIRGAYGIGVSLKSFITSPWQITIFPKKFGGEQLGPIFLAIIPALVLIKPIDRNIKRILVFLFAYFITWFFTYQNLRFLLPIATFLSIVASYVVVGIDDKSKIFKKALGTAVAVCLIFSLSLCAYHDFEGAKVVLGLESKGSYLSKNERSYVISEYINKNLPKNAKILVVNEEHTFFIDKDNIRELYYWIYTRYDKKYKKPEEILNIFKAQGFTHILYAYQEYSTGMMDEGLLSMMRKGEFRKKYLKLIYEQTPLSRNANGIKYMVYQI